MGQGKYPTTCRGGSEGQDSNIYEALFLEAYPFAHRAAQVRSARYGRILRAIGLDREDLEQDAMVGLWSVLSRFNPARASLRTYSERVVATSVASSLRRATAKRRTVTDDATFPADPRRRSAGCHAERNPARLQSEHAFTEARHRDSGPPCPRHCGLKGAEIARSDRRNSTGRGHPGVAEDPPVPVWTKGRLPAR
jgi:RNA polymerase sigma factor (sigma-70 family)